MICRTSASPMPDMATAPLSIQCPNPRCRSRHALIEGKKATCRECSNVWDWANPPRHFKGVACGLCGHSGKSCAFGFRACSKGEKR